MKVKLIDKVIPSLYLPARRPNFNHWSNKQKIKLAKSLIENKNIEVNRKKIKYPFEQIDQKTFVRKINLNTEYDSSYLNIFKYLHMIRLKPMKDIYPIAFPARRTSTYQYRFSLKPKLSYYGLDLIVFQAGFARSIQESRHFIKKKFISVNDKIVNNIKYIPKQGDIITNHHPSSLFTYFNQKYLSLIPKRKYIKSYAKKKKKKKILSFEKDVFLDYILLHNLMN